MPFSVVCFMGGIMKDTITVQTVVNAPMEKVWDYWNKPEYIIHWVFASDDWEAPAASNNLQIGGKFKITMAAKDKSTSFDFAGVYTTVKEHEMQRDGWQTILENFKKHLEGSNITQ